MAYLNWKQEPVQVIVSAHLALQTEVKLVLGGPHVQELAARLTEVFSGVDRELRVDLPQSWVMFFKPTEGESRQLLAHPQATDWVGSFILDASHGQRFLQALRGLSLGGSSDIELSALGSLNFTSNLELRVSRI